MRSDTPKQWAILARRSSGSVFGAASAWCKSNGEIMTFATHAEAAAKAADYNARTVSGNVSYVAARYE
jgi:hypothetical protein